MAEVKVDEQPDGSFLVTVRDDALTTTHVVRVPAGFPGEVDCAGTPLADLVAHSFAFLLAREPAQAILRRFSLDQIVGYFPEYPHEIRRMVAPEGHDAERA